MGTLSAIALTLGTGRCFLGEDGGVDAGEMTSGPLDAIDIADIVIADDDDDDRPALSRP